MRHVAAYLLAAMGSSQANAANIKAILGSVGVEADDKQLEVLLEKVTGKNIGEIQAAGFKLISSMPACGGGAAAAGPAAAAAPVAEEKKEEKKEEPEEESDDDMGFGLFD